MNDKLSNIPPQALDLEEAVIGAAMLGTNYADSALSIIDPSCFYSDRNRMVFQAIADLRQTYRPCDILSVKDWLKRKGDLDKVGGASTLIEYDSRVINAANIEYHCEVILQHADARKQIEAYQQAIADLQQSSDVPETMAAIDALHVGIMQRHQSRKQSSMFDIGTTWLERLETRMASDTHIIGAPTGIQAFDNQTLGLQPTKVTIIAARPSMGKTDWGLNIAHGVAKSGKKTAFLTLEMDETTLFNRLVSIETGLSKTALSTGDKDELLKDGATNPVIIDAVNNIINAGLYIKDMGTATINDIRLECAALAKKGVEVFVIDYLGLIQAEHKAGRNRNNELEEISRKMKMGIAKDLNVAVVALHQLSRAVETRGGDKRPIMSDLRDSGAIEQDADCVGFIYRPEYYGFDIDENGDSTAGKCEMIFAKNREGETGTVHLMYNPENGRIDSYEFPATVSSSSQWPGAAHDDFVDF